MGRKLWPSTRIWLLLEGNFCRDNFHYQESNFDPTRVAVRPHAGDSQIAFFPFMASLGRINEKKEFSILEWVISPTLNNRGNFWLKEKWKFRHIIGKFIKPHPPSRFPKEKSFADLSDSFRMKFSWKFLGRNQRQNRMTAWLIFGGKRLRIPFGTYHCVGNKQPIGKIPPAGTKLIYRDLWDVSEE